MKITADLGPSMNMCGTSRPGQMSFSADTYLMNGIKNTGRFCAESSRGSWHQRADRGGE